MKILFGVLVLASVVSLLCITLIPRNITREQVAEELDRMLESETVVEKNITPGDWAISKESDPEAFGATVSRSGKHVRIFFDQKKLRFQKSALSEDPPTPSPN